MSIVRNLSAVSLLALLLPAQAADDHTHHDHQGHQHDHAMGTDTSAKGESLEIERARNYFTDTTLYTQEGKAVRFYSDVLDDKVVLINVMYGSCKDACPMLTQHLARIKAQLGEQFGKQVYFVSISNDPDRDSPESLKKFAQKQKADHPGWVFLTGDKQNVHNIIKRLGLYSEKVEEHQTLLLAGNTRTRHWMKLQPNMPMAGLVLKLQELAAEG